MAESAPESASALDLVAPTPAATDEHEMDADIVNHADKLIRGTVFGFA